MGVKNHKWFLAFLVAHILITLYGSVAGLLVFLGEMKHGENLIFVSKSTGKQIENRALAHFKLFFTIENKIFGLVILMCFFVCITLSIFLFGHLKLISQNMTTNEEYKIDQMKKQFAHELKIIQKLLRETIRGEMPKLKIDGVQLPDQ